MTSEQEKVFKEIKERIGKVLETFNFEYDAVQTVTAALVRLAPHVAEAIYKGNKVKLSYDKGVLNLKIWESHEVDYIEITGKATQHENIEIIDDDSEI